MRLQCRWITAGSGLLAAAVLIGGVAAVAARAEPAPAQPRDPVAAKAYIVLETYCARCHQAGRGTGASSPAASSGLADILALDALARTPSLVRPGHADASPLYHRMFVHPHAANGADGRAAAEPSALEVEAVRDWIDDLGPQSEARQAACRERGVVGHGEAAAQMQRWLEQVGPEAARDTRFLTLAPLRNACATDAEMAAWRQAATLTVNSLSWAAEPVRLEAIGDTLTLFAVRLSALGWLPAHWEKLAAAHPGGAIEAAPEPLARVAGTAQPVLRADWLASAALRPPLYYELLGLPPTLADLGRLTGVGGVRRAGPDGAAADHSGAARIAIRASGVTRGARVVERLEARSRALWFAHDLAPRSDGRDPIEVVAASQPVSPSGAAMGSSAGPMPGSEAVRVLITLPNGLPGFAVFDEEGRRQPATTRPGTGGHGVAAGAGCMGCHQSGVASATDDLRAYLDGDRFGGDSAAREAARRIVPTARALAAMIAADQKDARAAVARLGVDPDLRIAGLAPVQALARQYDVDLGIERAAADLGLDLASFVERLKSFDGPEPEQGLALRLRQGTLPRHAAETLYLALRGVRGREIPATSAATPSLSLALWSDSPVHRTGDLVAINVQPSGDCHLTVISVDPAGKATVLFPNDFDQDNLVRGGRTHRIPARDGGFQLRLAQKGLETVIAICDTRVKVPDGIEHDFERQRFTVLGNWRSFLRSASEDGAQAKREPDRAARPRGRRLARGRQAAETRAEAKSEHRSDARTDADTRPDAAARAAIRIEVR